jgi:hypothetical protein
MGRLRIGASVGRDGLCRLVPHLLTLQGLLRSLRLVAVGMHDLHRSKETCGTMFAPRHTRGGILRTSFRAE